MTRRITLLTILVVIIGIFALALGQAASHGMNIYKMLKLLTNAVDVVYKEYVDPIDYRKLIKGAIDGMTSTLDPHTAFFTPKQYEELQIDTRGSFGGLGIQIGIRDNWLTVISPMEGTPAWRAGIQAGDRIIKIDGKSTKGITADQAVAKLRGEPGTSVTITIERLGEPLPFDITLIRDIIEIKPVPFYGMTERGVGYIRLASFSEEAGHNVRTALIDLQNQGAKGIILDLRSNPGGLLSQAVSVAGQFLESEALVVYTNGRSAYQSREYYTDMKGVNTDKPLVVLVDEGSASASEIVAGAIQDHDRGVIIGAKTFGKGLVQSVRPLADGTALKITTAKYYIPSGRCIQKEDYLNNPGSSIIVDTLSWEINEIDPWDFDSEPADTDTTRKEEGIFYTTGGRIVYGGGGITPDIDYKPPRTTKLYTELERKGLFFSFAVEYTAKHKGQIQSPDFEVSDEMISQFRQFIEAKDFKFRTRTEESLDKLDSIALLDSVSTETLRELKALRVQLEKEREREFERSLPLIKRAIKRDIVSKLWGESERYRQITLKGDPEVKLAEDIILDTQKYYSYLVPGNRRK